MSTKSDNKKDKLMSVVERPNPTPKDSMGKEVGRGLLRHIRPPNVAAFALRGTLAP